ncbi:hypothetical protein AB0I82_04605 [Streptomyces sp. NPDC050315]|uniref:hypothetical protein n=1 Tax=Streptomyces sp. NPDC050315 TaxID=3155039 RepID=UPI00343E8FED
MADRHHHAYVWLGHGDTLIKPGDAIRRPNHPEFRTTPVMPLECANWLLKTSSLIVETFAEPDKAAHWFAEQRDEHESTFAGAYGPPTPREDVARQLADGQDAVGGWWLTGGRFLSVNLIACSPHKVRTEYACPGP